MKYFLILTALICLFTVSASAQLTAAPPGYDDPEARISLQSNTFTGKVVGVHDGDTATVLDAAKQQHKIRFDGIDAPELKQAFGQKSKQHLSDLIFGKTVSVTTDKLDRYGRLIGIVKINGVDANLEQVKAGFAWHYKQYEGEQSAADRELYAQAEDAARAGKLGL